MSSSPSKPIGWLLLVLRLALGGIFVYAAWIKLRDPWLLFAMSIDNYHILPQWAVMALARTLPWAELVLGLLLIVGRFRRIATVGVAALLAVFFTMMVRAYLRGDTIDCGCFGPGEQIGPLTLLRDGSMLAGAVFLAVMSFWGKRAKDRAGSETAVSGLAHSPQRS
jgi:putative oxidoreductase